MRKHLLIVDDEQEIRQSLSNYFSLRGFDADTADNGTTALDILAVKHIDILISDIKLVGMDGVELLREVRKQYPMIRVIMITGHVTLENALACMRHGADACIFKPFTDLKELMDAVELSARTLDIWQKKLHELLSMKRLGASNGR